jgi:hypothetical protein
VVFPVLFTLNDKLPIIGGLGLHGGGFIVTAPAKVITPFVPLINIIVPYFPI